MKILMVSTDYPPLLGGISCIADRLSQFLAERGHQVEVVAPDRPGARRLDAVRPVRVFRTPGYDLGYLRGIPLLAAATVRLLLQPPDLLLPMNIAYGGLWALLLQRLGLRIPYLLFAHGLEFTRHRHRPLVRWLFRQAYQGAFRIFTNSHETRRRLLEFGVDHPRGVEVMRPGVDVHRFRPGGDRAALARRFGLEGRRVLLTVSRLVERKGHDVVLRALPRVAARVPEAGYLVVGDGPERGRLEGLARRLGLEDRVVFAGEVDDATLVEAYQACEVFVMASREIPSKGHIEGFGIVFLEAAACGKPALGGRSGGVVEAVEAGRTGVLVDPADPREVAEALTDLLLHPEMAAAMGREGRRRVEEQFTWERAFQPLLAALEEATGAASPSAKRARAHAGRERAGNQRQRRSSSASKESVDKGPRPGG